MLEAGSSRQLQGSAEFLHQLPGIECITEVDEARGAVNNCKNTTMFSGYKNGNLKRN